MNSQISLPSPLFMLRRSSAKYWHSAFTLASQQRPEPFAPLVFAQSGKIRPYPRPDRIRIRPPRAAKGAKLPWDCSAPALPASKRPLSSRLPAGFPSPVSLAALRAVPDIAGAALPILPAARYTRRATRARRFAPGKRRGTCPLAPGNRTVLRALPVPGPSSANQYSK